MKLRNIFSCFVLLSVVSCSGMKVQTKEQADQAATAKSKPGVTWGGNAVGAFTVDKGFWCDVRGGILTFGASGPTEAQATENAKAKCHGMFKDSPCDLVSCKHN